MTISLSDPLYLPCGAILPNRIAKASLAEFLATTDGLPTPEFERLYSLWSDGGAGLLLSGHILIDRDHVSCPCDVVIDRPADDKMMVALTKWAQAIVVSKENFWFLLSRTSERTMIRNNKLFLIIIDDGLGGSDCLEPRNRCAPL